MMSSSPHAKAYEAIWQMKQRDPNAVLGKLCAKYKVSYQSYNNWVKKYKKSPEPAEVPAQRQEVVRDNPKEVVTVKIPLSSIITAIRYHRKEIIIPRERVLEALSEADKLKVATAVGLLTLKHGPATGSDGLAADDGEMSPSKRNPFDAKSD